jgi:hypothetical protein
VSGVKPADVRFYFDQDVLGLAHVIAALRSDCTYPGDPGAVVKKRNRPACPIAPGAKDPAWIPEVARRGWLIITRDSRIQSHRAEVSAVRDNGARMIALSGDEARSTWHQLEIVMQRWRRLEELLDQPGPFIYTATRTSLKPVNLA